MGARSERHAGGCVVAIRWRGMALRKFSQAGDAGVVGNGPQVALGNGFRRRSSRGVGTVGHQFHEGVEWVVGAPVRVVPFGSHARGKATRDSDVDPLVVVLTLSKKTLNVILETAWEVSFGMEMVFSVVPLAGGGLQALTEFPLFRAVQREGSLLVS